MAQPYVDSYGAAACKVGELAGYPAQPWQADMLDEWGAHREDGSFIHGRCGGSIPRQAGKSVAAIIWAVFLVVVLGMHVLWTDHNYSTTCEMLRRFREIFGRKPHDPLARHPYFNKRVREVNNKTAQEAYFFTNGGSLHFSTRTKSSALGFSFDVIFYDEAQELTEEQQQAIMATFTSGAHAAPQVLYLGTPPRPGGFGTIFAEQRADALAEDEAARQDLCWWEWSVAEVGDVRDESRWHGANPSLGSVANIEAIRIASHSMSALAFAQEFMGYWLPTSRREERPVFEAGEWDACAIGADAVPREGRLVFAFKFSLDGSRGVIAACRRPVGGLPHVEVVHDWSMAGGLSRFVEFATQRATKAAGFVIDGGGNAQAVADALSAERVAFRQREKEKPLGSRDERGYVPSNAVVKPSSADICAACSKLESAVAEGKVTHFGQGDLDNAVLRCVERPIGKSGHGYRGMTEEDNATMAEAVALALWGVDKIKRDPSRKMRVL